MVLRVCRGVLRDEHDAEDAFQATFLVLARKAGSIRSEIRWAPGSTAWPTTSRPPPGRPRRAASLARDEGGRGEAAGRGRTGPG